MNVQVRFGDSVSATVLRSAKQATKVGIGSVHHVECWRDGRLAWVEENHNLVTTQGLNALLDIMFHASTQIATWYVAIIESNTAAAAGMTYATPTYTESTAYGEATRPAFVEAAAAAGVSTNTASPATFTINATKTIYGTALVGGGTAPDTKADAAGGGTLFCYSLFSAGKAVVNTDVLKITISLTAADA